MQKRTRRLAEIERGIILQLQQLFKGMSSTLLNIFISSSSSRHQNVFGILWDLSLMRLIGYLSIAHIAVREYRRLHNCNALGSIPAKCASLAGCLPAVGWFQVSYDTAVFSPKSSDAVHGSVTDKNKSWDQAHKTIIVIRGIQNHTHTHTLARALGNIKHGEVRQLLNRHVRGVWGQSSLQIFMCSV